MQTIQFSDNWNGSVLMDCFPVIRPANEGLGIEQEVEIRIKDQFAGYAKIVQGGNIHWQSISEGMSFLIIGRNSIYLKTVLAKLFGFNGERKPHPEFPVFFGFAQWTQRHMPTHTTLFNKWYKKAGEKHTQIYQDSMSQEQPMFSEEHS